MSTPSGSSAALRNSLQGLLYSSLADKIVDCLSDAVTNAPLPQLHALSEMLSDLSDDAARELHCVRCHAGYTENANGEISCRISHHDYNDPDGDGSLRGRRTEDIRRITRMVKVSCCGEEIKTSSRDSGVCVEEYHTTDLREVEYYDRKRRKGNYRVQMCAEFKRDIAFSVEIMDGTLTTLTKNNDKRKV
ncbi:hypothetical protein BDQ12DRAFT_666819 [Crucibulum laeve]|uniref:Uncharacterized protein n=1 Tax=Crucibulum laeve TaxID=68775 RepID=A0A5C3LXG8_9AGAR|nr:hypothetical protein BDQ12DRAFT_666819 [Crucibulum laeve]